MVIGKSVGRSLLKLTISVICSPMNPDDYCETLREGPALGMFHKARRVLPKELIATLKYC